MNAANRAIKGKRDGMADTWVKSGRGILGGERVINGVVERSLHFL